jgi:AcrR family transcriptional regulator
VTATDTRTRILEAAVACVERWGLAKTSIEDVANEAGLSRATVYRHFGGGRDELVTETIAWEVAKYLGRLAEAVEPEQGIEAKLVRGLVFGHQAVDDHLLLQRVLSTEPDLFMADFQPVMPVMAALLHAEALRLLADERLRPGIDADEAAGYVTGLFLSYLGSPGQWDLTDETAVHRLVRTQFLAGILEPEVT